MSINGHANGVSPQSNTTTKSSREKGKYLYGFLGLLAGFILARSLPEDLSRVTPNLEIASQVSVRVIKEYNDGQAERDRIEANAKEFQQELDIYEPPEQQDDDDDDDDQTPQTVQVNRDQIQGIVDGDNDSTTSDRKQGNYGQGITPLMRRRNIDCKMYWEEATKELQDNTLKTKNITKLDCRDKDDPVYAGVRGEWIEMPANPAEAYNVPTCCTVPEKNKGKYRGDPRLCGGMDGWIGGKNYTGKLDFFTALPGFGCICKAETKPFAWKQSKTPFQDGGELMDWRFDKETACRLLGNRTILMLGDSTMQQAATTLMNSFLGTPCPSQISFSSSDTLIGQKFSGMNRGKRWDEHVSRWITRTPDVVLVGPGAHILQDADYVNVVSQVTKEMWNMQQRKYPNMRFVWRTSQPAGCSYEPVEVTNPSLAARSTVNITHAYHGNFYDRDLFLIKHIQKMADMGANMHVLDMRPLYSRSDRHMSSQKQQWKDCLHFCVPGPLDAIGPLFHEVLKEFPQ